MGRPAEFSRKEVINKALFTFRDRGYGATSVRNLEVATGLKPGSIYSAFGSKRQFFLETITNYYQERQRVLSEALITQNNSLEGLRTFFDSVVDNVVSETPERCCYLLKSALELASSDAEIRRLVADHFQVVLGLFVQAIKAAQNSGHISADKSPEIAAKIMLNAIYGMNVESMIAPKKEELTAMVDELFALLTQQPVVHSIN